MTRRQIREQIFLLLFSAEFFSKDELDRQLVLNMREISPAAGGDADPGHVAANADEERVPVGTAGNDDLAYIESKTRDIFHRLDEIDARINACAEGWKTSRMGKTELAVIRLAVYEMIYEKEIPVSVAINEAVELAKVYCSERGAAFVNGVLAKLV